jgi:hypothetical protein
MHKFIKNEGWYKINKINQISGIEDEKDNFILVDDISVAIQYFSRLKVNLDNFIYRTKEYMINNYKILIDKIREQYIIYQDVDIDTIISENIIDLYYFLKNEEKNEEKGIIRVNKGCTAKEAVVIIDEVLNNNNIFKTLIDCVKLLNEYITNLETNYQKKGGGIKMKALKSHNTPKKTTPKKTHIRK